MKKFWKKTEGFTLVELIVVIAILGILAGVGTVGYSGYIKKANMAADQQALAALNQAFSAACIENGLDQKSITDAEAPVTSKKVTTVDVKAGAADAVMTKIESAFVKYFGSEGATFKMIEELEYSRYLGFYSDLLAGSHSYAFGDSTVTISAADKAILSGDNAFKDRGSAALLADVGTLEGLLGTYEDILGEVAASEDFIRAAASYMGMNEADYDSFNDFKYSVQMALEGKSEYSAEIMFAASSAANASDEQIAELFTGTVTSNIEVKNNDGSTDNQKTMANAALAYGMYDAYLQRYYAETPVAEQPNFTDAVNSPAFATYYESAQGKADLEAYMAAMNMISDNTSNSAITSSILENGISGNSDLAALMLEIMGN